MLIDITHHSGGNHQQKAIHAAHDRGKRSSHDEPRQPRYAGSKGKRAGHFWHDAVWGDFHPGKHDLRTAENDHQRKVNGCVIKGDDDDGSFQDSAIGEGHLPHHVAGLSGAAEGPENKKGERHADGQITQFTVLARAGRTDINALASIASSVACGFPWNEGFSPGGEIPDIHRKMGLWIGFNQDFCRFTQGVSLLHL